MPTTYNDSSNMAIIKKQQNNCADHDYNYNLYPVLIKKKSFLFKLKHLKTENDFVWSSFRFSS